MKLDIHFGIFLTTFCWNFDVGALQKSASLEYLEKLKNVSILGVGRVDTAENESLKV